MKTLKHKTLAWVAGLLFAAAAAPALAQIKTSPMMMPAPAPMPAPMPVVTAPAPMPAPMPVVTAPAPMPAPMPVVTAPAPMPAPKPVVTAPAPAPTPAPMPVVTAPAPAPTITPTMMPPVITTKPAPVTTPTMMPVTVTEPGVDVRTTRFARQPGDEAVLDREPPLLGEPTPGEGKQGGFCEPSDGCSGCQAGEFAFCLDDFVTNTYDSLKSSPELPRLLRSLVREAGKHDSASCRGAQGGRPDAQLRDSGGCEVLANAVKALPHLAQPEDDPDAAVNMARRLLAGGLKDSKPILVEPFGASASDFSAGALSASLFSLAGGRIPERSGGAATATADDACFPPACNCRLCSEYNACVMLATGEPAPEPSCATHASTGDDGMTAGTFMPSMARSFAAGGGDDDDEDDDDTSRAMAIDMGGMSGMAGMGTTSVSSGALRPFGDQFSAAPRFESPTLAPMVQRFVARVQEARDQFRASGSRMEAVMAERCAGGAATDPMELMMAGLGPTADVCSAWETLKRCMRTEADVGDCLVVWETVAATPPGGIRFDGSKAVPAAWTGKPGEGTELGLTGDLGFPAFGPGLLLPPPILLPPNPIGLLGLLLQNGNGGAGGRVGGGGAYGGAGGKRGAGPCGAQKRRHPFSMNFNVIPPCNQAQGTATAAPNNPAAQAVMAITYQQRYQYLAWLGQEFPGYNQGTGQWGLWAGIFLQTKWQGDTGRDRDYWWAQNNWSLNTVPYILGQWYRQLGYSKSPYSGPTDAQIATHCGGVLPAGVRETDWPPGPPGATPPHTAAHVCKTLFEYFRESDKVASGVLALTDTERARLRHMMWMMHEENLGKANFGAAAFVHACAGERNFQNGWAQAVNYVGASNIPPTTAAIFPGQPLVMPTCYPLGAPGCRDADLPPSVPLFMAGLNGVNWFNTTNPVLAAQLQQIVGVSSNEFVNTFSGISFLFTGNTAMNPDILDQTLITLSNTANFANGMAVELFSNDGAPPAGWRNITGQAVCGGVKCGIFVANPVLWGGLMGGGLVRLCR